MAICTKFASQNCATSTKTKIRLAAQTILKSKNKRAEALLISKIFFIDNFINAILQIFKGNGEIIVNFINFHALVNLTNEN